MASNDAEKEGQAHRHFQLLYALLDLTKARTASKVGDCHQKGPAGSGHVITMYQMP
jgi:hypothetical protein